MNYTKEKTKAINLALTSHSLIIENSIKELREVRNFLETKIKGSDSDIKILDKVSQVDRFLKHIQIQTSDFKDSLKQQQNESTY